MRKTWGTRPPWGSSTLSQPSTTLDWTMSLTPLWSWCLSNSKIYGGSKRSSTMRRGYWMCVRMHSPTCKHRLSYAHTVISLSFVLSSLCLNWTHSLYFSSLSVLHIRNNYLRGSTWAVHSPELNVVSIAGIVHSVSHGTSGLLLLIVAGSLPANLHIDLVSSKHGDLHASLLACIHSAK